MRLAVYSDHVYYRKGARLYADRAFVLFLSQLAEELDQLVLIGKISPVGEEARYPLSPLTSFVEVPYFASLVNPISTMLALARSVSKLWRVLDDVDGVWLLEPHPFTLVFALLARMRRRSVAIAVRQDFRRYVRARHPSRRWIHLSGDVLDAGWRLLARYVPVIAVGNALADIYAGPRTLEIAVSLVRESDITTPDTASRRDYNGELQVLTVGRLETEKNPMLLIDIIELLVSRSPRWHLIICGEGRLEQDLRKAVSDRSLSAHVKFLGYVPVDQGLIELYRTSHALLHVSWTEGVPQILFESFAARLPVVATDVGGVKSAVSDAALLVPPGDAGAAADAVERVCSDPEARASLIDAGLRRLSTRTLEAEARRVAMFLRTGGELQ